MGSEGPWGLKVVEMLGVPRVPFEETYGIKKAQDLRNF